MHWFHQCFSRSLHPMVQLQTLSLQNSFNAIIITFHQEWKNLPRHTCILAPVAVNASIHHSSAHPLLSDTWSFALIISLVSQAFFGEAAIFLDCFVCKNFPHHSPRTSHPVRPAAPETGAGEATEALLITKEGQSCTRWLARCKASSREQHLLGNLSLLRQEGHALISIQSWCAIPLLG